MVTTQSNEPRWRRPPVDLATAIPSEPIVFRLPQKRRCANDACGTVLSFWNPERLCFACQDPTEARALDLARQRGREEMRASRQRQKETTHVEI